VQYIPEADRSRNQRCSKAVDHSFFTGQKLNG
jgi:hypothetical protein